MGLERRSLIGDSSWQSAVTFIAVADRLFSGPYGSGNADACGQIEPGLAAMAADLLSPAYRVAMTRLTRQDLTRAPMEVNVIRYGPGAFLGPHVDLEEKIVTQVLYFNEAWNKEDGECLRILGSSNPRDAVVDVLPVVGNSVVVVRSKKSRHTVSPVADSCSRSRRSVNVIFHRAGSISSMWPPRESPKLRDYDAS
jgi:SM-20-related protein